MRYFLAVFSCTLTQRLKRIKSWLVILLLPLIVIGASQMTGPEASTPVTVGVIFPDSGGQAMWELLSRRSDDLILFALTDADTLERNVAAGKWDCGLIFEPDFDQRLQEGDWRRSITVKIGPGSTVYPLVQETVSACVAQLAAPTIAMEYLSDVGMEEDEEALYGRLEAIREENKQVGIHLTTVDNRQIRIPELTHGGVNRFLCWLISAAMLVRMLFGTTDLGKWACSGAAKRFAPLRSTSAAMIGRVGADGLLLMLSGCLAMAGIGGGAWGCLAVLGYGFFWISLSALLAQFPKIHQALPGCIPFGVIISFLISSVLVDISILFPFMKRISQWSPSGMFLRVCDGDGPSLWPLLALAVLCMMLSLGYGYWRRLPSRVKPA